MSIVANIKKLLSPKGREKYSDIRKYVVERVPRIFNQIIGSDLRYQNQIRIRKLHLGSRYDGKVICPTRINSGSVIYSFGCGRDISFDLALIDNFEVEVHAFDPTPNAKQYIKNSQLPEKFRFYDYGIASFNGFANFHPYWPDNPEAHDFTMVKDGEVNSHNYVRCPVYNLKTIMKNLGHSKIDLLKIDIEGNEYSVIKDILDSKLVVDQLVVEFHHRFEFLNLSQTKWAVRALNSRGYKIFHITSDGLEYSFIRV